jgi:sarcosine oxidase
VTTSHRHDWDVVVGGLGALGSAAVWALARAGARVLGLEQFELGHHRGASHDHARIIRRSYHTPGYVRLAGQAYDAWAELEWEAEERLLVTTGGLDLFPAASAIPPGPYRASLEACGVPYQWLDAAEVMRRWPAFRLDQDVRAPGRPMPAWSRPPPAPSSCSAWPGAMGPPCSTGAR